MKLRILKTLLLITAFIFFFFIKIFNYDRYPLMGHLEEYAYSWMGINLIENGVPQTWSPAGKLPGQNIAFSGKLKDYGVEQDVTILSPWLDLPPLYGLLSGGVAHLYKSGPWTVNPASYIRLPAILFSLLTSLVLFLFIKKLFDFKTAFLAMTIYSLTPVFVFGSRLSVAENGIAFLYLLSIYLTLCYIEKKRWYILLFLPILAGIAGLFKQTGFFIVFFEIFLLAKEKLWKEGLFAFLGTLYFVGVLFGYGASVNFDLFKLVSQNQSLRPIGFQGLPVLLQSPGFSTDFLYDGWYVFHLLSIIYFSISKYKDKKIQIITSAFIFWAMVVVFSGGQTDILLWYHYPFFPYLAAAGALMIFEIIKAPNLITSILIIGLLLTGQSFLSNEFRPEIEPMKFRFLTTLLLTPIILFTLIKKPVFEKISKIIIVGVIITGLFLNSKAIYSAFPIKSASKAFPIGPGTALNEIHLPFIWRFLLEQ